MGSQAAEHSKLPSNATAAVCAYMYLSPLMQKVLHILIYAPQAFDNKQFDLSKAPLSFGTGNAY